MTARDDAREALRVSPHIRGASVLQTMPTDDAHVLLIRLATEMGVRFSITKGQPAYRQQPGWHLLVSGWEGWYHILDIDRMSADDQELMFRFLSDLASGHVWMGYRGGRA